MADLSQIVKPEFYMPPSSLPVIGSGLMQVSEYMSIKIAEAMVLVIQDVQEYRDSIQSVGEGKYLRRREQMPSILDGEGDWNLPAGTEDRVGEDTA